MLIRIITIILLYACFLAGQNNIDLLSKSRLAESFENAGELKKASELYAELVVADPSNYHYIESLNRIYIQLKNYAASVNLLESAITRRQQDVNLYGLLGSTYYLMGNEEKAFDIWEEALKVTDPNPVFYRVIAAYAVERRAFSKAIEFYNIGKELSEDKTVFSFDLARLYSLTMQYKKSVEEYCSILSKDPSLLQTIQTKILADANKPDALNAAISVIEEYINDENLSFSFLLARLSVENKNFERAYSLYLDIDKRQSKTGAELYRYAHLLLKEGEFLISKNVYQSIIEQFPSSPLISASKLGYAKSLEAMLMKEYSENIPLWKPYFSVEPYKREKVDEVVSAFNEVVESYKASDITYEALLRTGMIKFHLLNDFDGAKIIFNKVIQSGSLSPSAADAYEGLGDINLLNGNLVDAERNYSNITILARVKRKKTNNAKYKLARVKLFQGDYDQSQKLLSEILLDLKDNSANDALDLSLLINTSKNDSASLELFAQAEFLLEQKKFSDAAETFKLLAENPQAFVFHSIASLRYAEMYLAMDKLTESADLFGKIVEEGEKNIYADKALYLLAEIYQYGLGDNIKAIETYEQLLAKFPASIYIDKARAEIIELRNKIS